MDGNLQQKSQICKENFPDYNSHYLIELNFTFQVSVQSEASAKQRKATLTFQIEWESVLGRGFQSVVYKGFYNGTPVAVKRIISSATIEASREEKALLTLNHPNVIKLLGVHQEVHFKYNQLLFILRRLTTSLSVSGASFWNCALERSEIFATTSTKGRCLAITKLYVKWPVACYTFTTTISFTGTSNRRIF